MAARMHRLPPYLFGRINAMLYQKRRAGDDVIDLGMGNPSEPPTELVIEKLVEAARDPRNHGYSQSLGIMNLRREVASKYFRKFGVRLDPDREVVVCLGSKEGFSHLCLALMGPGDTAVVPAPYFPVHVYGVALAAGNAITLEVADSEQFLSNVAYTCERLHPKPKLLIVNYPHNPSTVTVEPEFFVEVVKLAKRYGFMVISDFAYADIAFDGYQPPSFLAAPGAIDVGVEFTTMSKGYNMAGWRVGFCAGNPDMVKALGTIKAYYDYGMFQAVQIAAIMALRHTEAAVEAQAALYQSRRDVLVEGLRRIGWGVTPPRAGMFVWAKVPDEWARQMNTIDFAMKLLEQADVAVSPGTGFGPAGEGYLRLALVENENRLRQAVRNIARCLSSESKGSVAAEPKPVV
jgi:alanine-synthesizing transaminase